VREPEIPEDRDPVWPLLKQARPHPTDEDFTRRVMASVREQMAAVEERRALWRAILGPRWRPAWVAAIVATVAFSVWTVWKHEKTSAAERLANTTPPESAEEIVDELAPEFEMLDEIEALLEPTDVAELDEDDVGKLLF
jgi:hypothetical protein